MYRRHLPALAVIIVALVATLMFHTTPTTDYDPANVPRPGDHITFSNTLTPHGYLDHGEKPASVVRGEIERFTPPPGTKSPRTLAAVANVYAGWSFTKKTICLENRTGSQWWRQALVGAVVNWRAAGINIFYREFKACPVSIPQSQQIYAHAYSKDDGACGYMQPWLTGNKIWRAEIWMNMHPKAGYVACRYTFANRLNLTTHEVGHALGLGHDEKQGVMATGHIRPYKPSALDIWRVKYIYRYAIN